MLPWVLLALALIAFGLLCRRRRGDGREWHEAWRGSQARLRLATEVAGVAVWEWLVREDRSVWDEAMFRMYGLPPAADGAIVSRAWEERVHPDDLARVQRELRAAVAARAQCRLEFRIRQASTGEIRIVQSIAAVVDTARGPRVLGVNLDVTEHRRAEEARHETDMRFRHAFEYAGIGMALVRPDGRWLQVNAALTDIVGYDAKEMMEMGFQQLTHPDDVEADMEAARRLLDGGMRFYQVEKRYRHRSGRWIWVRLTTSLVRDKAGVPLHFVSQIEDISARKQAAVQQRAFTAQLAARNDELREFVYAASHDLQEPLRKIRAFGERLEARLAERLDETEREHLARMRGAAQRMGRLLDALLSYARLGMAEPVKAPVDLGEVARTVRADLEWGVDQSGGGIEIGPLPTIEAEAVQMGQLLQNLIGNALKYRRPEVPPRVVVAAVELDGPDGEPWIELTVADNGIGFEPRHAERIFGVFQRLHSREEFEGTGMGLAICRRIVSRHGGMIRAESVPGAGSRFVVRLPVRPARAMGEEAAPLSP